MGHFINFNKIAHIQGVIFQRKVQTFLHNIEALL